MTSKHINPADSPALLAFWREHRYATLTTVRPDGTPHVVPVSVTYEPAAGEETGAGAGLGTARVVAMRTSRKARNVAAAGPDGMRIALCQLDGGRWSTIEGRARIRSDAEAVGDAEERYEMRYGRRPRPNPERVLIEIAVDRVLGSALLKEAPADPESESGSVSESGSGPGAAAGRTA